jgi:hypothetical protein
MYQQIFDAVDTDGSGQVTLAELQAFLEAQRQLADSLVENSQQSVRHALTSAVGSKGAASTGDGAGGGLLRAMCRFLQGAPRLSTVFASWDRNGSGTLDRVEFSAALDTVIEAKTCSDEKSSESVLESKEDIPPMQGYSPRSPGTLMSTRVDLEVYFCSAVQQKHQAQIPDLHSFVRLKVLGSLLF